MNRSALSSRLSAILACALVYACSEPDPVPNHMLLVQALSEAPLDSARAVAICNRISDTSTVDYCLASVVDLSDEPTVADLACPQVEDTLWQNECYFMAAEAAIRVGSESSVPKWCEAAGQFRDRCLIHLWRSGAANRFRQPLEISAAAVLIEQQERLLALVGPDAMPFAAAPGSPPGVWRTVLLFYFRQTTPITIAACGELEQLVPQVPAAWCGSIAERALWERLDKLDNRASAGLERAICRHPARSVPGTDWPAPLSGALPLWKDDEAVHAYVRAWADERCGLPQ